MGEILASIKAVVGKDQNRANENDCLEEIKVLLPKWVEGMPDLIIQNPSSQNRKDVNVVFTIIENLCQNEAKVFEGVLVGDLFVNLLRHFCDSDYTWFVIFFFLFSFFFFSPFLLLFSHCSTTLKKVLCVDGKNDSIFVKYSAPLSSY